jgi:hypothetical protein
LERQFSEKQDTITLLRALDNVKLTGDLQDYETHFIDLMYDHDLGEEQLIYYVRHNLNSK